ncbi:MAG: hypothetical protein GTO63_36365 [Anaerolineae bacterium]|nr:hypothetical protein [Anaerolineae bacterium]NIO00229.1 hypothetical protein [Anaerolineae bacterium]NIQ83010.1 hypothetical protein [Anaerolineae bacterium]
MAKLLRPDVNTKFHIDYDWWADQGRDARILIWEQLCAECRARFGSHEETDDIDWVDPSTGAVTVVDGLRYCLRECCSQRDDYITRTTPLPAAIFRVLIANGNTPLSAVELQKRIGKSNPKALLRILLGQEMRTHYGIRPILG